MNKGSSDTILPSEKTPMYDPVEGERQERGWWTLRFQQVLREMQRKEPVATVDLNVEVNARTGARL